MSKATSEYTCNSGRVNRGRTERGQRTTTRSLRIESLECRELLSLTPPIETIGLYNPNSGGCGQFHLKNSDTGGSADASFLYGAANLQPLVGDWNGDGAETIGYYDRANARFALHNTNANGDADYWFQFGVPNSTYVALVGDWDGNGTDTIGLYDPATATFALKNSFSGGNGDLVFVYGVGNDGRLPLAGDWNGDGVDTIGLFNPTYSEYDLRNSNSGGSADIVCSFGAANSGWKPLVGDWNGDGVDTIGLYDPTYSAFHLKNSFSGGNADIFCNFGSAGCGWTPVVGDWAGDQVSFTDATVRREARYAYAKDGILNRTDMISILTNIGADDGVVDANELADCRVVLDNAAAFNIPDHVKVLGGDVVNTNPANTNSGIGNLAAQDPSTKLNSLVNKWFKGLSRPATPCTYQTAAGSLFVNGPSINDMDQGALGDCYFIAALGGLANTNASAIYNMFTDNGDNTWTVRFYYPSGGSYVADYVTVDRQLPTIGSYLVYANDGYTYTYPWPHTYNDSSNELWIALAEKAYAQWNETGRAERPWDNGLNTYAGIDRGYVGVVYGQVLGQSYATYSMASSNKQLMINALANGKAVMVGTLSSFTYQDSLYGSHAYAVTAYNAATDTFTLYNPWGTFDGSCQTPISASISWTVLANDCFGFATSDDSLGDAVGELVGARVGDEHGVDSLAAALTMARPRQQYANAVDRLFYEQDSVFEQGLGQNQV